MMFGLRDRFVYQECAQCGHIQLIDVPDDLARYYPGEYYSLGAAAPAGRAPGTLRRAASDLLLRLPWRIVDVLTRPRGPLVRSFRSLSGLGLSTQARVCDVGSGGGALLVELWRLGFRNLVGIDPHIEAEREVAPSVWVRKTAVEAIEGSFDAILLNHSLEHMASPVTVLARLRRSLRPHGAIVVRVPLAGTLAWRRYGVDWVGLDAPRHQFVPTERSLGLLAERAGLRVERVFHDSHALQFWGSEQYRRDIPLRSDRSWAEHPERSPFSRTNIAHWHRESCRLNAAGCGDSAGFVLRPTV
jgi:SAM-dependent methyltransferase